MALRFTRESFSIENMPCRSYVKGVSGNRKWGVLVPSKSKEGFVIFDEAEGYEGGKGFGSWIEVASENVPFKVRKRLQWLLSEE